MCLDRDKTGQVGSAGPAWRYKEPLNPQGVLCVGAPDKGGGARKITGEAAELIARADVIHCHDDGYPTMLGKLGEGKIWVHHAHIGDLPERVMRRIGYDKRVRHACITNGYGRHFDAEEKRTGIPWGRLADILEIENPILTPHYEERHPKIRVVYTYSNKAERGQRINAKSPEATRDLVREIHGVEFRWVNGVSFERAMGEKRASHVVLDEVFTPYTNLSVLEGAAVGACVLVNFDDYTRGDLCDWLGAPRESLPFLRVTPGTLRATIERLRDNPSEAVERGRAARAWMEEWYGTRRLLGKYLEFYAG